MIKTITEIKIKVKVKNGINEHGKDMFRSMSIPRVKAEVTPEQCVQVGKYLAGILGKEYVITNKVTDDAYGEE